ncbi:MAG: DUF4307 domain-containing protein [Mycobacteriales bacterium]
MPAVQLGHEVSLRICVRQANSGLTVMSTAHLTQLSPMQLSKRNAVGGQKFSSPFPTGRYGRRRAPHRNRRMLVVAAAVAVLIASAAVTWKLYSTYSGDVIDVRVTAFSVVSEREVRVQFELRKAPDSTVTCILRARSRDGVEVGRADVIVPAGEATIQNYVLATQQKAVTGEVLRCTPGERPQAHSPSAY